MNRLKTKIKNIEFINPFILASGPPTRNAKMIAKAFEQGWGGAVTKTICLNYKDMINVSPRIIETQGGLKNIELISPKSPEEWIEDIKFLKKAYPDNIVIASISAEVENIGAWQKLTLMMQDAGADILELNFSCPHGLPEMNMGNTCCDIPELSAYITKAVKDVSKIPVWVKLSPNVNNAAHLAVLFVKNGADGITAINTVKGFAGIDIETGLPNLNINGFSAYGGLSGGIIKPIALKTVSEIASSVNCSVSAAGGIKNWKDAIEFILLGASTIQVCTEVMLNGYGIIKGLNQGVQDYFEKHSLDSFDKIRGKSLKYIKKFTELDRTAISIPEINRKNCIKCDKCRQSCYDAGYQAIQFSRDGFLYIDKQKCAGCGLCKAICPVKCVIIKEERNICPHF